MSTLARLPKDNNLVESRTAEQREVDLVLIAQLYIRGLPLHDIAMEIARVHGYQLIASQLSNDLNTIRTRWQNDYLVNFDAHRASQLAHIDELERAYWEEWERSRKDREETLAERVVDTTVKGAQDAQGNQAKLEASGPKYIREKIKTRKAQRTGEATYLQGVQWCIVERNKMLGLYAPTNVNIAVNWRKQAKAEGYDPDDIIDGLMRDLVDERPPSDELIGAATEKALARRRRGRSLAESAKS